MYTWKLVDGKYRPKDLVRTYFERVLWTSVIALMYRMTKPLWVTGKAVIMDSGFCVLKVLVVMY